MLYIYLDKTEMINLFCFFLLPLTVEIFNSLHKMMIGTKKINRRRYYHKVKIE